MGKNYYSILGVPKDADDAALKKVRWSSHSAVKQLECQALVTVRLCRPTGSWL